MRNSVNGKLFKHMMTNGAINLSNNHKEIDALNVFPVPDGDTGTNMKMTMMTGVREMNASTSSSIIDIAKVLQRGLLMGARGNSGVILSQFFRGVYVGMKDLKTNEIGVQDFIRCLVSGYEVAYKAVMEPVEGTILTVVREAAQYIDSIKHKIKSFEQLFEEYIARAKTSLENTPNILPVLKEAGVVDSGGAGFLKVAEGMQMAILGKMLEHNEAEDTSETTSAQAKVTGDIKYGYCTEFIIELKNERTFQEADLRSPLSTMGDSLVLVRDENLVKVHVHVNKPGQVFDLAQQFGEFLKIKVENMRLQHSEIIEAKQEPKPVEHKKYALIAVCFGDGIKQTFEDLGVDYIIDGGQTMNPSTEEFVKAVKAVNADNIIIIPNNGNVILSAEQSVKLCEGPNIKVLKAKTIAQGYASLMAFDESNDIEQNFEEMTEAIKNVKTGEVTYAVRDTEFKGVKIAVGDYMGICNGEIIVSVKERIDATKALLDACVNEDSAIVTIFYGAGTTEEEVQLLEDYILELNEDVEVESIEGNQDIYSYIIAVE